ncbi:hypothetical protein ACFZDI_22000 [Streptomyces sp. NPDC007907]|uniref:hypothetical protein n=1 Tax=Streptomyces sp. NPDC007907 TaxID=3364789 RepID=UPI0036E1410D
MASLITGVFTWLSGRSHVSLQVADQRSARREQLRREVYARCIELLTADFQPLLNYGRKHWGDHQAFEAAKQDREERLWNFMSTLAELHLVGPRPLTDLMSGAHDKLDELERAFQSTLDSPHPSQDEAIDQYVTERVDQAGDFIERFCDTARNALGIE